MLDKVKEYYESEYLDTKTVIENGCHWSTPRELVNRSITNCLAIAQFSQTIGVAYEDVNPVYEEIKERLKNLLTN